MKTIKFILISFFILGFSFQSCSSDDDNSIDPEYQIVGTWKVSDVKQNGLSIYSLLQIVAPCPLENKYIFSADHTLKIETFEEGTISQNCVVGEDQHGTWSKEGAMYYVSFEGETSNSEVNFINDSQFITSLEFEGEEVEVEMTRQ